MATHRRIATVPGGKNSGLVVVNAASDKLVHLRLASFFSALPRQYSARPGLAIQANEEWGELTP